LTGTRRTGCGNGVDTRRPVAGTSADVTENPDEPTLDDVDPVTEQAPRDRHEHAKTPPRLNDDELARRTEHERVEAGIEDYDPDSVPPAEG
jgi:hypothetical protein